MSIEFERTCDKYGFVKCKECPRRFVTKTGFQNHLTNQHREIDTKVDQLQKSTSKGNKEEIAFQQKNRCEEKCLSDSLSIKSKIGLKCHTRNDHYRLTPHQCSVCKKSFGCDKNFKKHIKKGMFLSLAGI